MVSDHWSMQLSKATFFCLSSFLIGPRTCDLWAPSRQVKRACVELV